MGMQAVRADHEIEFARRSMKELDADAVAGLVEARNRIVEDHFDFARNRSEDDGSEISSREADVAATNRAGKRVRRKTRDSSSLAIHHLDFADHIARIADFLKQTHAASHVEAGAPKIDDVSANAERGSRLDQRRTEAVAVEPERESGTCDACTGNQNSQHERQHTTRSR